MSNAYKFQQSGWPHFVTFSVVNWIDLFTRKEYCQSITDSLQFCISNKGLLVHAWVIMPSHLHLILGSRRSQLNAILRDFKRFTSVQIRRLIREHPGESRKEWLIEMMQEAGRKNPNNKNWQLWQQDNHPIELWSDQILRQKLGYIHNNPVQSGMVYKAEEYVWSSAGDYAGIKGALEIEYLF